MNYQDNKISGCKIAYIGGGSRGWAWRLWADFALEPQISGIFSLYDIDMAAAKVNEKIGNDLMTYAPCQNWRFETADSLQRALQGADFIIISILPGTFEEMGADLTIPEEYGIYQSVGDTTGPGGILRGLRTIPMYVTIALAIKQYAPKAWVINYTNPMSLCVKTLYHVFPEIKAFGCCHEVFGTQKVLGRIYALEAGVEEESIPRNEVMINVFGINHFTWFDKASYKGVDLFPIYKRYVDEHFETGLERQDNNWANSTFSCAHRVKFDLFRRFGYIAAAGDRHLAEFMPGNEYLKDPDTVKKWKFALTPIQYRFSDLKERLDKAQRLVQGREKISLEASGEEGVLLIKALCGLTRIISNVNIPNTGRQIKNLPEDAVVETNAIFSRDGLWPVQTGNLPEKILPLIMPHVQNHEYTLKAALTIDFESALKAILNDPLGKVNLTEESGRMMLKKMIKNTMKYLPPDWKREISNA
jgi:galacturan 1,4-alpha-galacturonidase